ncbi:MAG TPA: hypothetical protein VKB72_13395 [Steroidobacteraceae bacterium]|nr:hypothetical protein [Steroidobacteraceae bacterium]
MAALLDTIVGALTPARVSGHSYLRTLLNEGGALQLVPEACVRDLVDQSINLARTTRRANKATVKSEIVQMLDSAAVVTIQWVRGGDLPVKENAYVPRTLVKYGVRRGVRKATDGPLRRHHVFQSYSHFRNATVTCAMCGWSGEGRKMKTGEVHEDAQVREYYCPRCGGGSSSDYLAVAPWPLKGESQE